ncbi:MAG TPA: beta-propeller domain-containing protein [Candidatus Paceibacterota bacterium]|nr:beta-propeller domain-containing protein [Verrucomicrobiota bacterium]HRY49166.1 beta-propeller domain-containing protein [Candidatus Paceibacterota bacterium]
MNTKSIWRTGVALWAVLAWGGGLRGADDSDNNLPPAVRITQPADGTTFALGETIPVTAVAEDPDGYASYAEFYSGNDKIGESQIMFVRAPDPGDPIQHNLDWKPATAGVYHLTVNAVDDRGLGGVSSPVRVTIKSVANELPQIEEIWIEKDQVVVSCDIPTGWRKVTLESRSRLGVGTWQPKAVQRLDGSKGKLTFRLDKSGELELLRLRADASEPLPATFYAGKTNFNGQASTYAPSTFGAGYWELDSRDAATGAPTANREVVESDIWKIEENTLYFFNQYRGLQIIDITQMDAPVVKSTLALPAAGEQMYVIQNRYVVLLARTQNTYETDAESQVLVVDTMDAPRIVAKTPVQGSLQESRLVGSALYIASQAYREETIPPKPGDLEGRGETVWKWGSVVTSIDLADPVSPVLRQSLWYEGYGNVIQATDRFLMVGMQSQEDYWQSLVRLVDITAPDGTMRELATIKPAGRVADKFKLNVSGDIFTVISEAWNREWGSNTWRASVLQTFSLVDPTAPKALGKLEVGHGEGLYATRFDGDRVYIVTFLRIDPLWVVDLKDPANPTLSGELEVPGWSTFIQPLGDRLVTIGIDNTVGWKVAVSLFDVKDPAKPGLLAKIPLGENSSWSEATDDEKAFTVLPDAGLILVPYQSWGTKGYASRVQVIDLGPDTLKQRGVIEHSLQPRRATQYRDRVVSISGRELLVVNATDRDQPVVTAEIELSWPVDRVVAAGDYLIEIASGESWNGIPDPVLRVVREQQTDEIVGRYSFGNGLPIVGVEKKDNRLYVLQGKSVDSGGILILEDGEVKPDEVQPQSSLVMSVFDLGLLPKLELAGRAEAPVELLNYSSRFKPVWPKPDLLVWVGGGGGWYGPWYRVGLVDAIWGRPWRGGSSGGLLFAFNTQSPSSPAMVSSLNLQETNSWWDFSDPHVADGLVYLSHQHSEFLPDVMPPGYVRPSPTIIVNEDGTRTTNVPPVGIWVSRNYLNVIDYADAANPTVRKPVNIPNPLAGISHQGSMLYTVGPHWDADFSTDWTQHLDASAYDGVTASLVDSLKLTNSWPEPLILTGGNILTVENGTDNRSQWLAWQLAVNGRFVRLSNQKLESAPSSLKAFGDLLAVQLNQKIALYDVSNIIAPAFLTSETMPGWIWPSLDYADGSRQQGLWVPLSDYGVFSIPLGHAP